MDGWDVAIGLVKVVVVFALLLVTTILLVWIERKVVADMQNRIGPERAGPWGILQTLADGLKLLFKEQIRPNKVEVGMYLLAPVLTLIPAFLIFMVIPIGQPFTVTLGGIERVISMQGTDLNVGLLYILAMSSLAVYAVVLAGWSSGSKYPLLGGVRATAQAISYEAAMGLALVPVVFYAGTLSISEIVAAQSGTWAGFIPRWNIIPLFLSFVIFFISIIAETNRAPFDLVEAEQEIVGGFHTEYSGFRFACFFLAEYINMFNMSAIAATLFLGGWNGPDFGLTGFVAWVLPIIYFFIKTFLLIFIFMWVRATLPRLRYDQLMTLGWKRLIPAALVWLVLSAVVVGVRQFGVPWS
jgi:NADH-quinone oxidoreductase subunit H